MRTLFNLMSQPIISVRGIGKRYKLGATHAHRNYKTLRDSLARFFKAPTRLISKNVNKPTNNSPESSSFWALKDVSFDVQPGEVLGIIGRNGAGKSTMLKILSQITDPTEGEIRLRGRVASLLEVGTGFHPELTGRENVYLNGAILGMARAEIKKKFDEIVAFAEVEKFLDTPVKRYSSGMYVRLAFAVAAHLEPEILLIDEVLAVGDSQFQKKCIGKMGEVSGSGRTVLFVSHNMSTITRLCKRVILLNEGLMEVDGNPDSVVHRYLSSNLGTIAKKVWSNINKAPGDDHVKLVLVCVKDSNGSVLENLDIRNPVIIEMEYIVFSSGINMRPWVIIYNSDGICVFATTDLDRQWTQKKRDKGKYRSYVKIPGNFLSEGSFSVTSGMAAAGGITPHFVEADSVTFNIFDSLDGDSSRGEHGGSFPGVVRPMLDWSTEKID